MKTGGLYPIRSHVLNAALFPSLLLFSGCAAQNRLISSGVQTSEGKSYLTPQGGGGWRAGAEITDPLEKDPRYKEAFSAARTKAEKILKRQGIEQQLGYCHIYWQTLKKVLRQDYHIDWKSPAELNPGTCYD